MGANTQVLQNIEKIQSKALSFKNPWEPSEQIYKKSKIFKIKDV